MGLTSGTKLGPYEIVSPLGAGGMGEVYRARDPQLGRDVAIKILPPFLSRDPERLRRFEQEARAAAALNHPNILAVYQMGTHDGAPYLVSELLEGSTLREHLLRVPMPLRKVIDYGIQIAHGLAAAHEKGIVHRDLKPENLFVTEDGRIKILDFGLAKLIQPQPSGPSTPTLTGGTESGIVLGTVGYMSPEQVRGQSADDRADLFAFGAILYEMLTGRSAFHKSTSAETMSAILNEEPPVISQAVPKTPPSLQKVLQRCLEKSPQQRFHSASDLAFALEALSDTSFRNRAYQSQIVDVRNGSISLLAGSKDTLGPWFATRDTLVATANDQSKLVRYDFRTQKWSNILTSPDKFVNWEMSPDGKYFYYSTGGNNPTVFRMRLADDAVEQVASLKNVRMVNDPDSGPKLNIDPDNSVLVLRNIGTEEVYALSVQWQ